MPRKPLMPLTPVLAQLEVVRCVGRSQQLEHRQGHAAGVDLLEHLADRLLGGRAGKGDRGYLVLLERLEEPVLKPLPAGEPTRIPVRFRLQERHLPVHRRAAIENYVQREHSLLDLPLARRQIQVDPSAEVAPHDAIRGNSDDTVFLPVSRLVDAGSDACVVVTKQRQGTRTRGRLARFTSANVG